jgi:hypothetical protein
MPDDYDKLVARAKDFLTSGSEWCKTCDEVAKFGQLAERSDSAVSVLLELASHENGMVRFLSIAALARVGAEPKRVVPLLVAVLDAWREMGYPEDREDEAIIALVSLAKYGTAALPAESAVWPCLYARKNPELRQAAASVLVNTASESLASQTIVQLLCSDNDEPLREFCRGLIAGPSKQAAPETKPEVSEHPQRYQLRVDGKELRKALKQLTLVRKRKGKSEFMVLSFADGVLSFSMDKITSGVSAEGTWPGEVVALAASIYGLARVPPKSETVRVTLEGDRLRIGSSVMTVEWMPGTDV